VAVQNIRLFEMAALDPLTGVHARRFFDRWLLRELRAAFRSGHPLSLLMMDMDGLKAINDTAGHLVGDQALSLMGRALRHATRNNDIIARYGGDEFAVILPQTDGEGAEHVARRLHAQLRNTTLLGPHGALALRGSVGLAPLLPPDFPVPDDQRAIPTAYFQGVIQALIRQADEALYQAKREGKSRWCRATPTRWQRVEPGEPESVKRERIEPEEEAEP
jgi:diguanylate cyclase (GGDEF)-like protein